MKRSRAPSSVAAAAAGIGGGGGRTARGTTTVTRGNSRNSLSPSHAAACFTRSTSGGGGGGGSQHYQEESQQSLEVDVGIEEFEHGGGSDKATQRRRSSRNSPASSSSSNGSGSGSSGKKESGTSKTAACPSKTESPENMKGGTSRSAAGRSPASPNGTAVANVEASDASSRGGGSGGGAKNRRGAGRGGGGAKTADTRGRARNAGSGDEEGDGCGGSGVKQEARGGGEGTGTSPPTSPPPKKKKKYIRNPETHKEYRARMEAELSQARRMLEEGNAAMVELARDYKRQQAIIDKYRNEDNSLQSFSQLTQSQPTNQQQQQQLQQLQLVQQQQQEQPQQSGGGPAACKPVEDTLPEPVAHETADMDTEMGHMSQDAGMDFSQASVLSLSHLADAEEPLSQANQWLAVFKDSQEAWIVDDMLLPSGEGEGEAGDDDVDGDEEERKPDSVEPVALAAEALSPSKQLHHQQQPQDGGGGRGGGGGMGAAPAAGIMLSPRMLSPKSSTNHAELSPMNPPPPLLPGAAAGTRAGAAAAAAIAAAVASGVVRVGVGCLVTNPKKPGCVLVGKRKGSIGAGTLALPGGHLEVGEEWPKCAEREVLEETGLEVETPTFSWVMNNPGMEGGKHYVTIFMLAAVTDPDKDPTLMEPDKCEGWSWETWKSLGDRLVEKRKGRGRGGSSGRGGRWGAGVRLFHPLAALRSTTYDPFKGVL